MARQGENAPDDAGAFCRPSFVRQARRGAVLRLDTEPISVGVSGAIRSTPGGDACERAVDGLRAKNDSDRELERARRACGLFHSCFPHEVLRLRKASVRWRGGRSPRRGRVRALTPGMSRRVMGCTATPPAAGTLVRVSRRSPRGAGRKFSVVDTANGPRPQLS